MKSNEETAAMYASEIRDLRRQVESLSRENTEKQLRINKGVRALDRLITIVSDIWIRDTIRNIQADLRGKR